ncbi:hypothetical protein IAG25_30600 [Caballeronia sp. EK]|uniref:hypothetical protein n=1 Tax=Caballeronia sp. EK TaxID=2767469 RepID=UPI00165561EF|nr:hypothetical protein [Caballeronia sp. EK]MBC8641174.1 hypothetical protein [Caballeronia sp. EK]
MIEPLYFNALCAEIELSKWQGFAVKQRLTRADKGLRSEIARRWRTGEVLAEISDGEISWILHRDTETDVLADYAFRAVSLDIVPAAVMLNFYLVMFASAGGSRGVFVGPSYKLWEARRNRGGDQRVCLCPRFDKWGELVTVNVAATSVRTASPKMAKAVPVFDNAEGVVHRSVGHRMPRAGELVRDPPAKGAKVGIPWIPNSSDAGPLASKAAFLHWLVGQINDDAFARLAPRRLEGEPVKVWIGARGQDAKLKKEKLIHTLECALPARNVAVYDRRTDAGDRLAWPTIVHALRKTASRFGMTVTDRGTLAQDINDVAVFIAIDAKDLFAEDESEDTKPAAVASFHGPVQCFSQSIVDEIVDDAATSAVTVAQPTFLVMLANVLIKHEVCDKQLLLHRQWVVRSATADVGHYLFCERFDGGEESLYVGVHVTASGALNFIESRALPKLLAEAKQRGLISIWKRKPGDPSLSKWPTAIEVADTPVKALPLLSRHDMTAHFSGVRVVSELNAYYAAGAERPGPGKVEKAVILRQVIRANGRRQHDDLAFIAGCCVDPTVRLHAATVWPGPFKLIREYMALYHARADTAQA